MICARKHKLWVGVSLSLMFAMWLNLLGLAAAPPHLVYFQTDGLPPGVSITITGTRTNPGGHVRNYSLIFSSPGPSAAIADDPGTIFTYSGFPASVEVDGQIYHLLTTAPESPFTAGASGGSTTVLATYAVACSMPEITVQPTSQTVVYASPVTLTVSATGDEPLTYQWYKDGNLIQDATASEYSIAAVSMADAGVYQVVVSNACGSTPSEEATLTVNRADQVITFDPPPSPATYGTTFSVNPSASSGLPVTLTATGGCSNDGYTVTMTSGTLTCTLTASQAGDLNYNPAADVVHTVQAAKASQVISFAPPASPAAYGTAFPLEVSASSGLPVTLEVSGVCTLNDSLVTMTSGGGACTITASQAGNDNYEPAEPVERVVEAARAEQTITFDQPLSPQPYGAVFTVSPSASSGLPVSLSAAGSCSLDGYTVTMTMSVGACWLTASQAGDNNYLPAPDVLRMVETAELKLFFPLAFKP